MKKRILLALMPLILTGGLSASAATYTDDRTPTSHSSIGAEIQQQNEMLDWIKDNIYYDVLYKTTFDEATVIDSGEEKREYIAGTPGYVGDSTTFTDNRSPGATESIQEDKGWTGNDYQKHVELIRDADYDTGDGERYKEPDDPEYDATLDGTIAGDGVIGLNESDGHNAETTGESGPAPDVDDNNNGEYDDGDAYIVKYAYNINDKPFTLPILDHDYYHFLGWDQTYPDDGITLPGEAVLTTEEGETPADHLYTAYWKDNLMAIRLNAGYTDKKSNNAYTIVKPVLAATHGANVELDDNGDIIINGSKDIHIAGAQDKINIMDADDDSCISLYIPDYQLVPGMEWSTKNCSDADSAHDPEDGEVVYDQSKTYHANVFNDADLRNGDAERILYANWEVKEYTISYNVGGIITPNVTNTADENLKPFWISEDTRMAYSTDSDKSYQVTDITGSHNAWTATQKYTVEVAGALPKPDRNYYDFAGWYVDNDPAKPVTTYEDLLQYRTSDNRDINLTAEWKPIEYTITYHVSPIGKQTATDITTSFSDNEERTTTSITNTSALKKGQIPKQEKIKAAASSNDEELTATQKITIEATGNLPLPTRTNYTVANFGEYNKRGGTHVTSYKDYFDQELLLYADNTLNDDIYYENNITATPYNVTFAFTDIALTTTVDNKSRDTIYRIPANPVGAVWNVTNKAADYTNIGNVAAGKRGNGTQYNANSKNGATSVAKTYNVSITGETAKGSASISNNKIKTANVKSQTLRTVEDIGALPTVSRTCYTASGKWKKSDADYKITQTAVATYKDVWNSGKDVIVYFDGWTSNHSNTKSYKSIHETCTEDGQTVTYCATCGSVDHINVVNKVDHRYVPDANANVKAKWGSYVYKCDNKSTATCTVTCTDCQAYTAAATVTSTWTQTQAWDCTHEHKGNIVYTAKVTSPRNNSAVTASTETHNGKTCANTSASGTATVSHSYAKGHVYVNASGYVSWPSDKFNNRCTGASAQCQFKCKDCATWSNAVTASGDYAVWEEKVSQNCVNDQQGIIKYTAKIANPRYTRDKSVASEISTTTTTTQFACPITGHKKKGHTYNGGAAYVSWVSYNNKCTGASAKVKFKCTECSTLSGEVGTNGAAWTQKVAQNCENGQQGTITYTASITNPRHSFDNKVAATISTSTTTAQFACPISGHGALGHDFKTATVSNNGGTKTPATECGKQTIYWQKCQRAGCGKSAEKVNQTTYPNKFNAAGDALAHTWTNVTSKTDNRSYADECLEYDTWYKHCGRCGTSARNIDNTQYFNGTQLQHSWDWGKKVNGTWVADEYAVAVNSGGTYKYGGATGWAKDTWVAKKWSDAKGELVTMANKWYADNKSSSDNYTFSISASSFDTWDNKFTDGGHLRVYKATVGWHTSSNGKFKVRANCNIAQRCDTLNDASTKKNQFHISSIHIYREDKFCTRCGTTP